MFTASLNLEALQKTAKGASRTCAAKGCEQPLPQTQAATAEYCADHSKKQAARPRRAKKTSR